jgi:WD40 repeat protein
MAIADNRKFIGKPFHFVVRFAIAGLIVGLIAYWLWHLGSGPAPDFAWPVQGTVVEDLHFSPDGKLLAVVARDDVEPRSHQRAYIYRASTGELIHKIDDAGWTCAWSLDGSAFAVVAFDPWYVDVWDTANWTRKSRLAYEEPTEHKHEVVIMRPQRICFDRSGNLYLSACVDFDGPIVHGLQDVRVWQDAAKGGTKLQTIPSCDSNEVDIACATIGQNTRLAISACPARVVTMPASPAAKPGVLREYNLSGLIDSSLEMTPDGRFLVVRGSAAISVIELFDDHCQTLHSWHDEFPLAAVFAPMHAFALSMNGQVAAYTTDRHVKVIRIPDGEKVLDLDFGKRAGFIALSPEGELLAISDYPRRRIRFYRVPPPATRDAIREMHRSVFSGSTAFLLFVFLGAFVPWW